VIDALHAVVRAAGEAPIGQVRTAGVRAFVDDDGTIHQQPQWLVVTTHRAWLLAVHGDEHTAVATGDRAEVEVRRGWVVDEVRVGPWTAPLVPSTRSVTEKLVTRWKAASPHGDSLVPQRPEEPTERAPMARGALDVPEALPRTVPAPPRQRWLAALRTRSVHPFDTPDGKVVEQPLWIGFTPTSQHLFSDGPDGAAFHAPVGELHDDPRGKKPGLRADRRHLDLRTDPAPWLALCEADEGERWAQVALLQLQGGHARDAMRLIAEALDTEHPEPAWLLAARLLYASGDPLRSMAVAVKLLRGRPDLPVETIARSWHPAVDAQAMRRDDADVHFLRAQLREHLPELEPVEPPPDLPWPPTRPHDVWAAALAWLQRPDEALQALGAPTDSLARLEAEAALREQSGADDAHEAWERAALAHREASSDRAPALLDRALALRPLPARHHLRAAWAWSAGDDTLARGHWTAAMLLDPDATVRPSLPRDAELALARHAEDEDELDHAAYAWARAAEAQPDDGDAWERAAALHHDALSDSRTAAELQRRWCEHADTLPTPPLPRWTRWAQLARYELAADRRDAALRALHEAVAHDVLRADALAACIAIAREAGADPHAWEHVLAVLDGSSSGPWAPPAPELDRDALDALHPGGAGWLDRMRQRLDTREAPERSELVRGLGRLDAARYPDAAAAVDELSTALGLDTPDVFVFRGEGAWGCSAWAVQPPVVLLGVDHLRDGPRHLTPTALRFLLAVELVHLAAGHPVLAFDSDLVGTSRSLYASFGRYASTAENVVDVLTLVPGIDQIAKLQTLVSLSRRVFTTRSTLDKVGDLASPVLGRLGLTADAERAGVGREGLAGAALAFRLQADRAALLLTGDLAAALQAILRSGSERPELADQLRDEGLLAVLQQSPGEAVRLTSLVDFAVRERPAGS
jgi:tetratricopeptide (TPR) repeat protein